MIQYLRGQIIDSEEETITILCGDVGYEVYCSQNTRNDVMGAERAEVWIHTHVREDSLQLYGFSKKTEKKLFTSLIKVNGVGPKLATTILSGTTLEQLIEMIESGDVKRLIKIPRVGKKMAEQMILSLKGQLVIEEEVGKNISMSRRPIVSALVNLGFKLNDVEIVVDELPSAIAVEEGVRQGLLALTTGGER